MTIRTSETTVNFNRPFLLGDYEDELPAGDYTVEFDEELLGGVSFPAYRRTRTLIHLPPKPGYPNGTRKLTTTALDLRIALERDKAERAPSIAGESAKKSAASATGARHEDFDHRAADQAENEGMAAE